MMSRCSHSAPDLAARAASWPKREWSDASSEGAIIMRGIKAESSRKEKLEDSILFSVEAAADGERERLRMVGFLEKIQLGIELEILADDVRAVTAGEDDL